MRLLNISNLSEIIPLHSEYNVKKSRQTSLYDYILKRERAANETKARSLEGGQESPRKISKSRSN